MCLFVLALALPAAKQLLFPGGASEIAKIENRAASAWPKAPRTVAELNNAPRMIENFVADRFGFRRSLIGFNLYLTDQLDLQMGERNALVGQDGWLFGTMSQSLELYAGRAPFREGEAERWLEALSAVKEDASENGAVFVAMIAPQKATVYSEYLPADIKAGRAPGRREVMEAGAALYAIPMASAVAPLRAAKHRGRLYYQTDTHWTGLGAYEAYRALMARLAVEGIDAPIAERKRLRLSEPGEFVGDLSRMLSQDGRYREETVKISIESPATLIREETIEAYQFDAFKTRIIESEPADRPSVLVLGDSFSEALLPFFRESFSRIVFIHHQLGAFDRRVFEEYPADVVVFEIAERFLTEPFGETAAENGDTAQN